MAERADSDRLQAEVDRLTAELCELRQRLRSLAANIEASWPPGAVRSIARSLREWAGEEVDRG